MGNIYFYIYSILLVVGGYIGYQTGGSAISLYMGAISGFLIFIGAFLQKKGNRKGITLNLIVSALLTIVFTIRFIKTGSFIPVGLLLSFSVVGVAFGIAAFRKKG